MPKILDFILLKAEREKIKRGEQIKFEDPNQERSAKISEIKDKIDSFEIYLREYEKQPTADLKIKNRLINFQK